MKIAIVGTGIAGNVAAYHLSSEHDITVYEAEGRIGGHTNTVDVLAGGERWAVDTGFIVFNDVTYPNFLALLDELGVEDQSRENIKLAGKACFDLGSNMQNLAFEVTEELATDTIIATDALGKKYLSRKQ